MAQIEIYDGNNWIIAAGNGSVQNIDTGIGLKPVTITTSGTLELQDIPSEYIGTYTYATIATDQTGRIESINGSAPVITIEGTSNQTNITDIFGEDARIALGDATTGRVEFPGNINIGNGSLTIPVGTTAERPPNPVIGMFRINTDL